MGNLKVTQLREQLEFAREETLTVAGRMPEGTQLFQPGEGRPTALWLMGHLANTINTIVIRWILSGENTLTKEQAKLFAPDFGGGDPPSTDASKYPTYAEVIALYDTSMKAAIAGLAALSDEDLDKPLPKPLPEPMTKFFPSIGKSIYRMISHDAYHRGQIGMLSKIAK